MTRTSLLAAPLILALAVALCFDVVAADAVADSCDAIRDFVDVSFCAARLRAVPGAAAADRHGHLLMAADLAAASGAKAGRDAAAAAAAGGGREDPAARDALRACAFLYGAASVPALRLMRGYAAARSWGAARSLLLLAGKAGIGCDAAIAGTAAAAAGGMAAANREFNQLSSMATALINN
ncbi:uncharacterized protein [Setaria viridis]|uniref:Pectinesterase inhibitor domain-containing protein n=1 Tax=Setaria viridis TaxID=4556 RepID=A0A4V6DDK0_SETVI|nr:uncharacterized protein LOC117846804 [Setaria viridis]TKW29446.1 hypothetical protein SEVIR_3G394700v2 [Setaria viridis]